VKFTKASFAAFSSPSPMPATNSTISPPVGSRILNSVSTTQVPKHVCLVGHAPSLAQWVRQLLGITASDALKLPKGALARLETENRRTAALKFLVTPKLLGVRAD
jgi:phosphohistidine phosphatase SixA